MGNFTSWSPMLGAAVERARWPAVSPLLSLYRCVHWLTEISHHLNSRISPPSLNGDVNQPTSLASTVFDAHYIRVLPVLEAFSLGGGVELAQRVTDWERPGPSTRAAPPLSSAPRIAFCWRDSGSPCHRATFRDRDALAIRLDCRRR